jgi:hypothetical protein
VASGQSLDSSGLTNLKAECRSEFWKRDKTQENEKPKKETPKRVSDEIQAEISSGGTARGKPPKISAPPPRRFWRFRDS